MSESYTKFEELTVSNSVITLTSATYGTLNRALITIADANMRFKVDGGTVSSTEGHILYDGDELKLTSAEELAGFQAIRDDSTDVELSASYGTEVSS